METCASQRLFMLADFVLLLDNNFELAGEIKQP
jgi:hypothetical protein